MAKRRHAAHSGRDRNEKSIVMFESERPIATTRYRRRGRDVEQAARMRRFVEPFESVGGSATMLGYDADCLRFLQRFGLQLSVFDVDRRRLDALRRKGQRAEKADFRTAIAGLAKDSQDIVYISDAANGMPLDAQRVVAIGAADALRPSGILVWRAAREQKEGDRARFPATGDATTILPHVIAPFGARSRFRRACVVVFDNVPAALQSSRFDPPDFFLVAQKDGPESSFGALDGAFADEGLDIDFLRSERERRLGEALTRLERHSYHLELAMQQAFEWRDAFTRAPAALPPRTSFLKQLAAMIRGIGADNSFLLARGPGDAARRDARPDLSQEPFEIERIYRLMAHASRRERNRSRKSDRLSLAYVSPLPPQRSGVASYSAELLPALSAHYEIDAIVEDVALASSDIPGVRSIRDAAWFRENAGRYDRVLYHFGNSEFHAYMLPLLGDFPGVVVMHDFYLGHLFQAVETGGDEGWLHALLASHGYAAARFQSRNRHNEFAVLKYPANLRVLQQATGIVAPNHFALTLARRYYGEVVGSDWAVIPHMHNLPPTADRAAARRLLGLGDNDFLVCCFGRLGRAKLNDRLLDAWLCSQLNDDPDARLIFVGEEAADRFCAALRKKIDIHSGRSQIEMAGHVSSDRYACYLAAADVAVQLRANTRGESSYAVLDCMAYGLPVVVNAHGPMAELPKDGVFMVEDGCDAQLVAQALDKLKTDAALRRKLGRRARQIIEQEFTPAIAAKRYVDAIESFSRSAQVEGAALAKVSAELVACRASSSAWLDQARSLARSVIPRMTPRRIFVDITTLAHNDARTGIQRVMRAQLLALIDAEPHGFRIEPVRASKEQGKWRLRLAQSYANELLALGLQACSDPYVYPRHGDIYFSPDLFVHGVADPAMWRLFEEFRAEGVRVVFSVYDILPLTRPEFFPPGADEEHGSWLRSIVAYSDALVCISNDVALAVAAWIREHAAPRPFGQTIHALHLGADTEVSAPTKGEPKEAAAVEGALLSRPSFLCVGTVEPRKCYDQTLRAFERLWAWGVDANLVIVGNEGWRSVAPEKRRNLPILVDKLRNHGERNSRLFWIEQASDEYLLGLYARSTCLIAASQAEGFGLPLVEAARCKLPILARDIPVFREICGPHATYFATERAAGLAEAIEAWLARSKADGCPATDDMPHSTWAQNGRGLSRILFEGRDAVDEPDGA